MWRKDQSFHKNHFDSFIRETARQAKKIQYKHRTVPLFCQRNKKRKYQRTKSIHCVIESRQLRNDKTAKVQRHNIDNLDNFKTENNKEERVWRIFGFSYQVQEAGTKTLHKRLWIHKQKLSRKFARRILKEQKPLISSTKKQNFWDVGNLVSTKSSVHSYPFKVFFGTRIIYDLLPVDRRADVRFISFRQAKTIKKHSFKQKQTGFFVDEVYRNITLIPCWPCYKSIKNNEGLQTRYEINLIQ